MGSRVTATSAAVDTVRRLVAKHGAVALFQSGGCCDGSSPVCLTQAEMPAGPNDVMIGAIDGVPVYIDAEQDERWGHPLMTIDVAPGAGDSFSLEGSDGVHFVARLPAGD
jgi:uncharacterized protein (DUF779 family)